MKIYAREYTSGFSMAYNSFTNNVHVLSTSGYTVTIANYVAAGDWTNKIFVFDRFGNNKGENYGFASRIATHAGNVLTLTQLVPNDQVYDNFFGEDFVILDFAAPSYGHRRLLGDVSDLNFSTSLGSGFLDASAVIPMTTSASAFQQSSVLGWMMEIIDDRGYTVWEGTISGVTIRTDGLEVQGLGFADSLNHYLYQVRETYTGTYNNLIELLNNVLSSSRWLNYTHARIDLDGVIAANTAQDLGEFKFDVDPTKAVDAISEILSLGDGSNDQNPLFLQIWEGRLPTLYVAKRRLQESDIDWEIDLTNIVSQQGNTIADVSLVDTYNRVVTSYNDVNGEQQFMMANIDWRSVIKYGEREATVSDGNISSGEADEIAQNRLQERGVDWKMPISASGMVKRRGGGGRAPVYSIRAGDVIYAPSIAETYGIPYTTGSSGPFSGGAKGMLYLVHRTSYDYKSDTLTIEPGMLPSRADIFLSNVMDTHQ